MMDLRPAMRLACAAAAAVAVTSRAPRATAAAPAAGDPPVVVAIRGPGAASGPGAGAPQTIANRLGGRLVKLVEPPAEDARAALAVADVVYLNLRQRSSADPGGAGLGVGRGSETLTTRAVADAIAEGSPPARLVIVNGSGAGAELGSLVDAERTAVIGFSAPVHGPDEERLLARVVELFTACDGARCPTLGEAFAKLKAGPAPLYLGGKTGLRAAEVRARPGNAVVPLQIKGTVTDADGKPSAGTPVWAPFLAGAERIRTDEHGAFLLTLTAPLKMALRVRAGFAGMRGEALTEGGRQDRSAALELGKSADDVEALAARLGVTVPAKLPDAVSDTRLDDEIEELAAAYEHDTRLLRFSLDELAALLARFEQAAARNARRIGPGAQSGLCDDASTAELRLLWNRIEERRHVYDERYARAAADADDLREVTGRAPHLANQTRAGALLAAARVLRRDHAENLRRLDAPGFFLRAAGCRRPLLELTGPLYDPDIPADFADRLPGGTHPTLAPRRD